jgi:hypothetical protein
MMKRETIAIADVYVPIKRRATLEQKRVDEIAASILANHAHMMAINFVRIRQTLRMTPAMAARVTDRLWQMSDMVKVLENWEVAH